MLGLGDPLAEAQHIWCQEQIHKGTRFIIIEEAPHMDPDLLSKRLAHLT